MKIVPVQKTDSESEYSASELESESKSSGGAFSLGRLRNFFSVDRKNRWPVQGWTTSTSGCELKSRGKLALQEGSRVFTVDKEARWPLQGWCKGRQVPAKSTPPAGSDLYRKPSFQGRWPQGW